MLACFVTAFLGCNGMGYSFNGKVPSDRLVYARLIASGGNISRAWSMQSLAMLVKDSA